MKSQIKIITFVLVIITSFLLIKFTASEIDDNFHLYFLDVGQGDALYARDKSGNDILIDGGPDLSVLTGIGNAMLYNDRVIDYLVLTHPHADHLFGLVEVVKRYEVKNIILTDAIATTQEYQEFLNIIKDKNIHTILANNGEIYKISDNFNFQIIYPDESFKDTNIKNLNNTSIVGKIIFGSVSIQATGDAEKDLQGKIANKYCDQLSSNIIKIAHHGSKNGINTNFFNCVNPEMAIISVGVDNKFGHPHQETLDFLNKNNVKTIRTDEQGTIEIISDGVNFWQK